MNKYLIDKNWKVQFLSTINEANLPKGVSSLMVDATVPGTIHTDLLNNGFIADPFYSDNENQLQWIGDCDWLYKTEFNLPPEFDINKPISLKFKGIDTIAKIRLNRQQIGETENMFRSYEFDVSGIIKSQENILEVELISAVKYAKNAEKKFGNIGETVRTERVYIRKAQYSFGWDWGPAFITSGIWKNIFLLQYENRIENILFETKSITQNSAEIKIGLSIKNKLSKGEKIEVELSDKNTVIREEINSAYTHFEINLNVNNPILWQPNGYGEAHLYNLSVKIVNGNIIEDEIHKKVGIRTIELKLKDDDKNTFQFVINGNPIYCKGVNWIPVDSFLVRVTEDKYRTLLEYARDGNMNVVRVWGGGIYEDDIFYNLCDELGLMVWQDFMFACANYPEQENLLQNIEIEVEENVARLQHHPGIIIWCGNNENEWIWYQKHKRSYKEMPGYKIFSELIPSAIKKIDTSRPYWESSPFSFDEDPNSTTSGNRHQWKIWSRWIDYKCVKDDDSLFVTEFGFQSPANASTLLSSIPKEERKINSRIFEFHNKQIEGPERLFRFLSAHLPVKTDIEDYIYLTQLNHAFAMKECLEHWRYRFPQTNGSIIWQINDCWPVSSWALVDSNLNPKLPYYFVKNIFAPQTIRITHSENDIIITGSNLSLKEFKGRIIIHKVTLPGGKMEIAGIAEVQLSSLKNDGIHRLPLTANIKEGREILIATLYSSGEELLVRSYFTYPEWKYLKLPKVKITTEKRDVSFIVSSDKPALFIYTDSPSFVHNGAILLPDEQLSAGKINEKINIKCLNDYLS